MLRRITEEYPYAGDLTLLGAHSSHSYQTGTNLYFVYDYDIDCEPREEIEKYHKPLNAIIVEEALRVGGSMVHHHGIGKYRTEWTEEEHGIGVPHPRGAQAGLRPARHHERRHDLPAAVSDLLVGIDLGSQSAKVVVYDARGTVVSEGREPLAAPLSPAPGVVEHPGDDLWEALCVASRRAMDDLGDGDGTRSSGSGSAASGSAGRCCGPTGAWPRPCRAGWTSGSPVPTSTATTTSPWVTASSGYLTHRLTGEMRDSAAAYQGQWPIDTARWQWLEDDRLARVRDPTGPARRSWCSRASCWDG